jgi:hypothetical protein
MKSIPGFASIALLALGASGCDQRLEVQNLTDPDVARVFGSGASIESTIGAGYQTVHNAMSNTSDQPGVEVFLKRINERGVLMGAEGREDIPRELIPWHNIAYFSDGTTLAKARSK